MQEQSNVVQKQQSPAGAPVIQAHATRKAVHLNDILSLYTGFLLAREGTPALHRLVAFLMETEASPASTALNNDAARACLAEQLPFLKDINYAGLHAIIRQDPSDKNPYISVWREMQALRFGEEHYLVPAARWARQKNSHKL